ncbi:MAG: proline--tRNA ligase [Clostridiales bacterium]|nr:proline--tRNA ligase [Clostridiales bacterium]
MEKDFAKWYTSVVTKAKLMSYSEVRGCMIFEPYGFAIWENIKNILDFKFKETGHENVYMPMLIPESLLNKEKEHVEGFAPEVAWVTHGGSEKLSEKMCIRPTSETLFCEYYSKNIKSYRDLPKLYNQWCSVIRWEKTVRPFLRNLEFLWQEGHTVHTTPEEAIEETNKMLDLYADFCENFLAISVIKGKKTKKEKFAGAEFTCAIESLMHDGKALQTATTHYFGDKFAKAFNIQFLDKNNKLKHAFQSSWGISTRVIGAIIMVHGDNWGLKIPPKIAPIQVVIVSITKQNEILEKSKEIYEKIIKYFKVKLDTSNKTPGWKYSEYEMLGVPLRLEIGPKDIKNNQIILVRRDTREKVIVPIDNIIEVIFETLDNIQKNMLSNSHKHLNKNIITIKNYKEFKEIAQTKTGLIKTMWCGSALCEEKIKEETGLTSRCIPNEQNFFEKNCICCGKKATLVIYWGIAY